MTAVCEEALPQCDRCTPLGFGHRQRPDEAAVWVAERREWLCEECRHMFTAPAADGLYPGIPDSVYHGDAWGSLSSSGARKLLPPSCPAIFKWERDNPPKPLPQFDIGKAAHKMILGVGEKIVRVDVDSWQTKAARAKRDQAHADGHIPMLAADLDAAQRMAGAVHEHPLAAALLKSGEAESSGYWHDQSTGVRLRFRPDWLTDPRKGRRIIVDVKTSTSASPQDFSGSAARFGYATQAAWYLAGAQALQLDEEPVFLFIAVDKHPPYMVSVIELDSDAIAYGQRQMNRAINTYFECQQSGVWPSWGNDVYLIGLPKWVYASESA
jgi:hypothetical protein